MGVEIFPRVLEAAVLTELFKIVAFGQRKKCRIIFKPVAQLWILAQQSSQIGQFVIHVRHRDNRPRGFGQARGFQIASHLIDQLDRFGFVAGRGDLDVQ